MVRIAGSDTVLSVRCGGSENPGTYVEAAGLLP